MPRSRRKPRPVGGSRPMGPNTALGFSVGPTLPKRPPGYLQSSRRKKAAATRVEQHRPTVQAVRFEDGSVRVRGPRPTGIQNVGEGGPSRGGYGTIRVFGPSTVRDPFARRRSKRRSS